MGAVNNARARAWQLHREALRPKRKPHAPVGEPEYMLVRQLACAGEVDRLAPLGPPGHGRHDTACQRCGFRVCSCAKYGGGPGLNAGEMSAYAKLVRAKTAALGIDYGLQPALVTSGTAVQYLESDLHRQARERSEHDGIPPVSQRMGGHGSSTWDREQHDRERVQSAELVGTTDLPPGWRGYAMAGVFEHSSGAGVVAQPNVDGWWYAPAGSYTTTDKHAPTRDEAMARSLGWLPDDKVGGWWAGGASAYQTDCGWKAFSSLRGLADSFASLPRAIAWTRGEGR